MMVRLKNDLVDLLEHGVNGTLDRAEAEWTAAPLWAWCSQLRGIPTIRGQATSSTVSTA
jgi:hypothetical protein